MADVYTGMPAKELWQVHVELWLILGGELQLILAKELRGAIADAWGAVADACTVVMLQLGNSGELSPGNSRSWV